MNTNTNPISPGQLQRLQVLWGQLCAHTDQVNTREARIGWAQALVMRPIASFKDLSSADATHLIDTLQGQLGIAPTRPAARPQGSHRKRLGRDAARKAGTEGRKGFESNEVTLATAADFARIDYVMNLLGWDQARLKAWLESKHSPIKPSREIRTLKHANRVWWALKGMAEAQGKWKKRTDVKEISDLVLMKRDKDAFDAGFEAGRMLGEIESEERIAKLTAALGHERGA